MSSSAQILFRKELSSGAIIAISPILPFEQVENPSSNISEQRQRERFSWQNLAREILQDPTADFCYDSVGAPQIVGSDLFISVSHSATLVAVIISPARCAIDIERLDRNFDRVAPRYATTDERELSDNPALLAQIWSIKETVYKYAHRKEIDLTRDIYLQVVDGHMWEAELLGELLRGEVSLEVAGHVLAFMG